MVHERYYITPEILQIEVDCQNILCQSNGDFETIIEDDGNWTKANSIYFNTDKI